MQPGAGHPRHPLEHRVEVRVDDVTIDRQGVRVGVGQLGDYGPQARVDIL